jgi:hypothetical protein
VLVSTSELSDKQSIVKEQTQERAQHHNFSFLCSTSPNKSEPDDGPPRKRARHISADENEVLTHGRVQKTSSSVGSRSTESLLLELIFTETDWGEITAKMNAVTGANRKGYISSWYRSRYSFLRQRLQAENASHQRRFSRGRLSSFLHNTFLLELIYSETDWVQLAIKLNDATGTNRTPEYYQSLCSKPRVHHPDSTPHSPEGSRQSRVSEVLRDEVTETLHST